MDEGITFREQSFPRPVGTIASVVMALRLIGLGAPPSKKLGSESRESHQGEGNGEWKLVWSDLRTFHSIIKISMWKTGHGHGAKQPSGRNPQRPSSINHQNDTDLH